MINGRRGCVGAPQTWQGCLLLYHVFVFDDALMHMQTDILNHINLLAHFPSLSHINSDDTEGKKKETGLLHACYDNSKSK
jgi:hypothetical protein